MHLGIESAQLAGDHRGIGRYVRKVVAHLLMLDPSLTVTLAVDRDDDAETLRRELPDWPADPARVAFARVARLRQVPMDACWYPWNVIRWTPPDVPVVVTVHDLVPLLFAPTWWRKVYTAPRASRLMRTTLDRADALLANSAFTAAEVRRVLGDPRAAITVTPLAADDFLAAPSADAVARAAALDIPAPYVLAVGAGDARKNLGLLLEAGAALAARGTPVTIAVLGPGTKLERQLTARDAPWLKAPGFVDDAVLAALYAEALALVFPSRYEGFGLPVLEAMAAGAPVITTREASLPEVAGEAALYVDPDDAEGLADAIMHLAANDTTRARLRAAGRARASQFSWRETASRTLDVIRGVLRPRQDSNL
ncbi:MAG: glycosyltransferase family 4 protein [Gemmatimonadaceae bacterium]|nr:glycosyltransferase family 4 protein [Gemmatimonadaceae bacterium]